MPRLWSWGGSRRRTNTRSIFRIIREESERLTALINNILDFSRIEAGRKEYEFQETDLGELVHSTWNPTVPDPAKRFAFEENISPDNPAGEGGSRGDRAIAAQPGEQCTEVFQGPEVHWCEPVPLEQFHNLEVRDSGIGIPGQRARKKSSINVNRCGDPLVHDVKGSGLGPLLVRHIARAHGGDVLVESGAKKGQQIHDRVAVRYPLHKRKRNCISVMESRCSGHA